MNPLKPLTSFVFCLSLVFAGCEGPAGPAGERGEAGINGEPGETGEQGEPGESGEDGEDGRSVRLTQSDVVITLEEASMLETGEVSVEFTLADGNAQPLDRTGVYTDGTIDLRFVLSRLDAGADGLPAQAVNLTPRTQTSAITGESASQGYYESEGTYEELSFSEGRYRYTFMTAVAEPNLSTTYTIGVWGVRTLLDGTTTSNVTSLSFVPDASSDPMVREVVTDASCSSCHGEVAAHGGTRKGVQLCISCHDESSIDPDTGNTLDFSVMVHKIHRGAELPSVAAGESYEFVGYMNGVNDYSHVEFPQNIARCESCHDGDQAAAWATRPSKSACTSCHDDISFEEEVPEGMRLHSGGTQPDNAMCAVCHPASGSLAGVTEMHLSPYWNPDEPELVLEVVTASDTPPGGVPSFRFRVTVDGTARDILTTPLDSLRVNLTGPNTDFASYTQVVLQGRNAAGTIAATDTAGEFTYTFPASAALSVEAVGSYSIGLEGYVLASDGTTRLAAVGPIAPFAVTDDEPEARREVVSAALCNNCHYDLRGHGGSRRGADSCTVCHNANNANDDRVAHYEDASQFAHTVDLRVMIHKIHAGRSLSNDYLLGGNPTPSESNPAGTVVDFSEVVFPRSLSECTSCHLPGTYGLPLPGRLPSLSQTMTCTEPTGTDTDSYCDTGFWVVETATYTPAETAVCTSCHDSDDARAHATIMTTATGEESCAVCHGSGRSEDVEAVHSR